MKTTNNTITENAAENAAKESRELITKMIKESEETLRLLKEANDSLRRARHNRTKSPKVL